MLPFLLDDHIDHRRASALLLAVAEQIHPRTEIWAYQVYSQLPGNVVVDITEMANAKAEIVEMFKSQTNKRDWAHYILGMNAFTSRLLNTSIHKPYAEAFFVLPLNEYKDLCEMYFLDKENGK